MKDPKKKAEKDKSKQDEPVNRWDLDSYKAMDQDKGIYDWSRRDYNNSK